jgi:ribosomal protein S18 acetylase RimI-like enzyme
VNPLDQRVWTAHGDAWQAEGRLRASLGGGAAELPGARLMASGLPHPEWNNADVIDPALVSVEHLRAWYAERAHGAGVPWGVRVPAGHRFPHGRHLFRKRCMALLPGRLRSRAGIEGVRIRAASAADAGSVAHIDATAFEEPVDKVRPWVEPHLDASGFVVALAELDSEPAGVATAVATDGRAGHSVGVFGVAVLPRARRRGIAAAMVCWLLQRAFAEGAAFAHLNPNTDAAARLYAGLGFEETAGLDVYVDL